MATQEYDKNNTTRINLKLNNKTDADIIGKLDKVENVQGYIKAIIRTEIEGVLLVKEFKRVTNEMFYGARKAGYRFDVFADREVNKQLVRKLLAERGELYIDAKMDEFCDFDGDLYVDENGTPYAVEYIYDSGHEVPLCWQKLAPADYHIKPEYLALWGKDATEETVIHGYELKRYSDESDKPFESLLEQLELIEPKRISVDNGAHWVDPEEAVERMPWDVIANHMEDEAREQVHMELAPCENINFLKRYLYVAKEDLVIG